MNFYSLTVRAFKLDSLEDRSEDYGQTAVYDGGIEDYEDSFMLDDYFVFITGKEPHVCGNTATILGESRYAKHFKLTGDRSQHFGLLGNY